MEEAPGAHCRICGSKWFNESGHADDLSDKIGLYRVLKNDISVDRLIRPCECRGVFEFAHKICLSNWIETSKHEYCDICRFKYNIRTYDRSFFEWLSETQQVKSIFRVICWCTLVYYISSLGILNYQSHRTGSIIGLMVFVSACIWSTSCTLFVVVYTVMMFKKFFCWKSRNRRVEVEENRTPQLEEHYGPKDVLKFSGFRRPK